MVVCCWISSVPRSCSSQRSYLRGYSCSCGAVHRPRRSVSSTGATLLGSGHALSPDPSYKIVGGGAQLQSGSDHILVASYPLPESGSPLPNWSPNWLATDLRPSSTGLDLRTAVTAYSLQLKDPDSRYRIVVTEASSKQGDATTRPSADAVVPAGFTLAGGGCKLKSPRSEPSLGSGARSRPKKALRSLPTPLLVGSYPIMEASGNQHWVCEAPRQQQQYEGDIITAYAIGIKDVIDNIAPPMRIVKSTSPTGGSHPTATADLLSGGFAISGCRGSSRTGGEESD
jgi:hypothetical protein